MDPDKWSHRQCEPLKLFLANGGFPTVPIFWAQEISWTSGHVLANIVKKIFPVVVKPTIGSSTNVDSGMLISSRDKKKRGGISMKVNQLHAWSSWTDVSILAVLVSASKATKSISTNQSSIKKNFHFSSTIFLDQILSLWPNDMHAWYVESGTEGNSMRRRVDVAMDCGVKRGIWETNQQQRIV